MRAGRYDTEDNQDYEEYAQGAAETAEGGAWNAEDADSAGAEIPQDNTAEETSGRRGRRGRKSKEGKDEADLSKLKKRDLLEIMLKQGEEIDRLREQVAELEAQLEDRQFKLNKVGSIAEASLAVTKIFEEAEKAAVIYLENIRSKVK